MISLSVVTSLFALALLPSSLAQTTITKCPTAETTYDAPSGLRYVTCPGSDFVGSSSRVVANTADASACVQLCAQEVPCDKSVYDNNTKDCHLKSSDTYSLKWTQNARYTASRRVDVGNVGKWGPVINLPIIPVAAYVVPNTDRLLFFSAWSPVNFGGANGYTQFADYNWKTGQVSQRTISNTKHDMFCPGISALANGSIIITGGSNAEAVSLYHPNSNSFSRGPNMKIARGYQSSATLSDGRVFTIGGSWSGGISLKPGEVYNPSTNAWTLLPNADPTSMLTTDREGAFRTDNHAWLYSWSNGTVFQAGPSKIMHWLAADGSGSIQDAGVRDTRNDQMCAANVMFEQGKILSAGGAQDYDKSQAFNRAHLISITTPFEPATVEQLPSMRYPRGFGNAVVLPTGEVLVSGGQARSLVFTNTDSSLPAELFSPVTKSWTVLAEEARPRNYHSVSILLADGTVFSGGGGLCYVTKPGGSEASCNRAGDHLNGQIFSPPYLFNEDGTAATRPVISSVSVTQAKAGASIVVRMANENSGVTFSLIRIGTVTHSINTDQRRIALRDVTQAAARYSIQLPSDYGSILPGYWYIFANSAAGVPSVAKVLQIIL